MKNFNFTSIILISISLNGCKEKTQFNLPVCEKPDTRPNILWITCEDLSPRLRCYGDKLGRTPNLDKLAQQGTLFTRAYVTSPVSAPSRATIITGMYAASIGAQNMRTTNKSNVIPETDKNKFKEYFDLPIYEAVPSPEVKCFTEYLRASGYYCINNSKTDYNFKPPATAWDECGDSAHWRHRPAGKPFFAVFNIAETHECMIWKNKKDSLRTDPEKIIVPPFFPDTKTIRRDIAQQYDNMENMDKKVGEIISMLKQDGLLNNTIIFFFSDHGDGFPRYKRSLYETGIQIPFIMSLPGKEDDKKISNRLISTVDLAPTMLSLAGIPIPAYMQGKAFAGKFETTPRQFIYATADRIDVAFDCSRAVCDTQFKYIHNYFPQKPYIQNIPYRNQMDLMQELYKAEKEKKLNKIQKLWFAKTKPIDELYDLKNDPYEINNLATNKKYKDILKRMQQVEKNIFDSIHDLGLIPEKELIRRLWHGDTIKPTTFKPEVEIIPVKGDSFSIKITCRTPGASIGYKLKSKNFNWQVYTTPFIYEKKIPDTLETIAHRIGYNPSEILKTKIAP